MKLTNLTENHPRYLYIQFGSITSYGSEELLTGSGLATTDNQYDQLCCDVFDDRGAKKQDGHQSAIFDPIMKSLHVHMSQIWYKVCTMFEKNRSGDVRDTGCTDVNHVSDFDLTGTTNPKYVPIYPFLKSMLSEPHNFSVRPNEQN